MTNTGIGLCSFICGAALGAATTWFISKKILSDKYNKIAQDEIDSVKSRFTVPKVEKKEKKEEKEDNKDESLVTKPSSKPTLADYAKRIKEYTNYSDVEKEEKNSDKKVSPYVISPDEYGEDEDYDQKELTYYADGILADEDDEILNADEVLGKGSIDHMGEYEDDALHVKNESLKIYYEILVDERSYERATGKTPHLDKDEED